MARLIFSILSLTLIAGCSSDCQYENMVLIDSLIHKNMDDSAFYEIKRIDYSNIRNKGNKAYYYLLKTQILFRQGITISNDSMIDRSITYYQKANDTQKLAQAYYFKGRTMYARGDAKNGTAFLKKAEYTAKETEDYLLITKIYISLAGADTDADDFMAALNHCRMAMRFSELADDKEMSLYCMDNLANIYGNLGETDSAVYYLNKCIPLLQYIPYKDRSVTLANIAAAYEHTDKEKAKSYARQSIAIKPQSSAYHVLATIYRKEGKYADAEDYWNKAMELSDDIGQRISILQDIMEYKRATGKDTDLSSLTDSIMTLWNELAAQQRQDSIKEIQMLHEIDMAQQDAERSGKSRRLFILLMVATGIALAAYLIIQRQKAKKALNRNEEENKKLSMTITKLEINQNNKQKQITELKRKMRQKEEKQERILEKKHEQQKEILTTGHSLHKSILTGKNIAKWEKQDTKSFIEYYNTIKPDFTAGLNRKYKHLTPHQQIYLILQDMGLDEKHICEIMCVKADSLRVTKMRIKSQLRA